MKKHKHDNKWKAALIVAGLFAITSCETFNPDLPSAALIEQDKDTIVRDDNVYVLVRTREAASQLLVNAARRNYQLIEQSELDGLGFIMLNFRRPPGVSGAVAIQDMERASPGATAGVEHFYTLQANLGNTRQPPRLYADSMVSWPEQGCSAHTTIGMIDGGINQSVSALKGADIVVRDFSGGAPRDIEHGTAIADLLVGRGRLKGARLYSASVISQIDKARSGTSVATIIQALDWLDKSGVTLVNISLAGPYNKLLDRVIQKATDNGMRIIAAVGNDGPRAEPRYPAALDNVIAVTAIDSEREIYANAVHGTHVDFSAPGVDVFVENGRGGAYLSGTSVAAPFVTALIASDKAIASSQEINFIRKQISRDVVDLGETGHDPVYGAGLVISHSCEDEIALAH